MALLTERQVFAAISQERQHQRNKYGPDRQQSLPGFLLIAKRELDEAIEGWNKDGEGRDSPLYELCQVAAVCVAAMEKYGTIGNTISTDDVPDTPIQPFAVVSNIV
jgi:hypothetical protein